MQCGRHVDDRPVRADRIRKSVGAKNTFAVDLFTFEDARDALAPIIDQVWRHCESLGIRGRTVTPKIKYADFQQITRSHSVRDATDGRMALEEICLALLKAQNPTKGVRLLGVSFSALSSGRRSRRRTAPARPLRGKCAPGAAMKKIGRSDIIGQRGMAHIESVVLSMGFMFYPTGGVEAGIDGFIEIRDKETGAVGNLLLQVQGKATERQRLQAETEDTFEFPCSEADISYWMQGTAPVLFIVVHLEKGVAYWKSIKAWFSDPDRLKARKIVFDKKVDLFTKEAKAAVTAVALSTAPGATAPSVRIEEDLLVNLVGVSFAQTIYWAPTSHSTDKSFGAALRELDPKAGSEWIVRGKAVLSFHNLDAWPWNVLCEAGAMEEFRSVEWSDSDDDDRQRDFVALLNRAMSEFVRPALWHDQDSGAYFFPKPKDRDKVKYAYKSLKSFVPRDVVNRYGKKQKDPSQPAYWRHSAFLHRFVRLGGDWFVEITSTYHFTIDGYKADPWSGERLKKIKEFENNAAVLGQFVMWRYFFVTHRAEDLYTDRYPYLAFAPLEPLSLHVGVPDDLWKSQEANPDSPLFDWAQAEGMV